MRAALAICEWLDGWLHLASGEFESNTASQQLKK
jgi:hypothetical protein